MSDQNTHGRIEILTSFGSAVRNLRLKQGFSQEGFADHCGLDRTYIGGVERGERTWILFFGLAFDKNEVAIIVLKLYPWRSLKTGNGEASLIALTRASLMDLVLSE